MDDPRCVFSKIKEFFKRYDFKTASAITGASEEEIKKVADTLVEYRPGTVMYALGDDPTHRGRAEHPFLWSFATPSGGTWGKPGAGINALRGEPNVQGSTDMACLFGYLPGYLGYPNHNVQDINTWTTSSGTFRRTFLINLLKAWFGEHAQAENDYCFNLLPKKNGKANYSVFSFFEKALEGQVKFLFTVGQNPLVTQPNLNLVQAGLENGDGSGSRPV